MATVTSSRIVPLGQMSSGQCATLFDVIGRPDHVQRLKELGFRGGAALEMVRSGSPCIVRLAGQTLCIRGNELLNMLVECEE
jgi:ferrous iron transport protein A